MVPTGFIEWKSTDGWTGTVRHFPGPGEPVLLVHGMGANHFNWDYRREVSLAASLQDEGWDVWIPDLRGDPGTRAPARRDAREFDFDHHATQDLPAIVDAVLEATSAEQLSWVGHSMGGMLLYTALAQYPEKIAAGVAIASPVRFDDVRGLPALLQVTRPVLAGPGMVPLEGVAAASAVLGRATPFMGRLSYRDNVKPGVLAGLRRSALQNIPRAMAHQALGWLRSGELTTREGEAWLRDPEPPVPLLVLAADADRIAPLEGVLAACEVLSPCEARTLGLESGMSTPQGHIDPVLGRHARTEVYPDVSRWLRESTSPDMGTGT